MEETVLAVLGVLFVYSVGFVSGVVINDRNRRDDIRQLIEQHEAERMELVQRFMLGKFTPGKG